jgi:hypothetical protein
MFVRDIGSNEENQRAVESFIGERTAREEEGIARGKFLGSKFNLVWILNIF